VTDMKKTFSHPFFLLGLLVRIVLIASMPPTRPAALQIPFLDASISHFPLDPWHLWLAGGGVTEAFPYGYAMWLGFLPSFILFKATAIPLWYAYAATILAADMALLILIGKLLNQRGRLLQLVYWLSPIVIVASYLLGSNDLIPVTFLVASLLAFKNRHFKWSGVLLAAAVSAKIAMIIALPLYLIYLWRNHALRLSLFAFGQGAMIGAALLILPFLFSGSGVYMLLANPEMRKVWSFALSFGDVHIYLLPLIYLVLLYLVWRIRRINFQLFFAALGIAFMLPPLSTQALPGWFIWAIPFLVAYQLSSGRIAVVATGIFSSLYLLDTLLVMYSNLLAALPASFPAERLISLVHTILVAVGIVLVIRMWRETVSRNHYFRLSLRPLVIGIAGDSGAGKDTLSSALTGLFGSHSVTALSGDDYHLWDRQTPTWQVLTHLNPIANDLERYTSDLVALMDGKDIMARHYDHKTGRMSHPMKVKSRDIIIASGLHQLYLPFLRELYDLSIYLDINEKLRRYLKIHRDVHERGHSLENVLASFDKREPDAVRFVRPQKEHANIVFSLIPDHPDMLKNEDHPKRYQLTVTSRSGVNEAELARALLSGCGLYIDVISENALHPVTFNISGEVSADDMAFVAEKCCVHVMDFLDIKPVWQNGALGLMQLITLFHLEQILAKRLIQ